MKTGAKRWQTAAPSPSCSWGGGEHGCAHAQAQAVTVIPGVAFSGSMDGHLRAYSTIDGKILWDYDTAKEFATVNGVKASGGSLDQGGATIVNGVVYVNSGGGRAHGGRPGQCPARILGRRQIALRTGPMTSIQASSVTRSVPCALRRLGGLRGAGIAADHAPERIENSVVKVFATMRYPDPFKPWTKQAPSESDRLGRGDRRQAHLDQRARGPVRDPGAGPGECSRRQSAGDGGRGGARHRSGGPAARRSSFFDTHPPLARASELPQIKDAVLAYGFPTGGTSLSITKGIVSRIEFVSYNFPTSGLRIQVDAAINPGNSGGPAIAGDKMIGLAFSKLGGDTQNIGYIIPNEEVDLFLKDIADGHYDGKPAMYDDLQTLENPALRDYLKLDKSVEGMVVHRPYKTDPSYPLKEWDVITRIGDTPIDNQGMVKIDKDLRVHFGYLIQQAGQGRSTAAHRGSRAARRCKIQLPVSAEHPTLVRDLRGSYPPYFIYGPMVFSTATWQLVSSIENNAGMMRVLGLRQEPAGDPRLRSARTTISRNWWWSPRRSSRTSSPTATRIPPARWSTRSTARASAACATWWRVLRDLKDPFVTIEFDQKGGEALVFSRHGDHGRHRRDPHRQRRPGARVAGHARRVAGEGRELSHRAIARMPPASAGAPQGAPAIGSIELVRRRHPQGSRGVAAAEVVGVEVCGIAVERARRSRARRKSACGN